MDFLKEIVKEIGDDYTQIASEINENERFIDTGSFIFNGLISGFRLLLSKTFWTLTLMGIVSILTLKQPSIKDYWSLVELIRHGWLL